MACAFLICRSVNWHERTGRGGQGEGPTPDRTGTYLLRFWESICSLLHARDLGGGGVSTLGVWCQAARGTLAGGAPNSPASTPGHWRCLGCAPERLAGASQEWTDQSSEVLGCWASAGAGGWEAGPPPPPRTATPNLQSGGRVLLGGRMAERVGAPTRGPVASQPLNVSLGNGGW